MMEFNNKNIGYWIIALINLVFLITLFFYGWSNKPIQGFAAIITIIDMLFLGCFLSYCIDGYIKFNISIPIPFSNWLRKNKENANRNQKLSKLKNKLYENIDDDEEFEKIVRKIEFLEKINKK